MSFAITRTNGDGSTPTFAIGFSYRDEADLIVKVNGVTKTLNTHFKVTTGGTIIDFSQGSSPLGNPPNGHSIFISRATSQTSRLVDYAAGSVFKEADLDTDSEQGFFMAQEAIDIANEAITVDANNRWDAGNKRIINVADPVDNQDAVNKQFISTNIPNITTVAGISSDVSTVAGIAQHVSSVAGDATDIGTVATNISSVNTVATNIADVVTVANDLNEAISEIETAADDLNEAVSEIDTVAQNISNVNAVGNNISDVTTVAGISSNVSTVAGIDSQINTVSGISSSVPTVAAVSSNVTTVAGIAGNVTTVAGISSDVSTVASNNSNVTSVAGNATNINTVAGAATNINTVASNLTNVNNFADTYSVSATAPASPTTGDLWFDSTNNVMKVYDGTGFVNAGSSVNGTSQRYSYVVGTSSGSYTGSTTVFPATYDSGYVDFYLNGVKLVAGTDFTATNGTSITLTTAAATSDTVDIVAYGTFNITDVGGSLSTLGIDNHNLITVTTDGDVTLTHTGDAAASGPRFDLKRNSATPAANDFIGAMRMMGEDSASNETLYAVVGAQIGDPTNGQEDGIIELRTAQNGTEAGAASMTQIRLDSTGIDIPRTNDNLRIGPSVEGQTGAKVMISEGDSGVSPQGELFIEDNATVLLQFASPNSSNNIINFGDPEDHDAGEIQYSHSTDTMTFRAGSTNVMYLTSGGLRIGANSASNELDDYEEGTFQVGLTGSNLDTCKYVKVGRMVTVTIGDGAGTGSGGTYVSDGGRSAGSAVDVLTASGQGQLPFTPSHICHGIFMGRSLRTRDGTGPDGNATYVWTAASNSAQLYIGKMTQSDNRYSVINGIISNDDQIRLEKEASQSNIAIATTFTYFTDS